MKLKIFALFLIIFMSTVVNLPDSTIAKLGFEADYLLAALYAIVIAGLIADRTMLLVVLVVGCAVAANLPEQYLSDMGVSKDILIATLVALVVVPFITGKVGSP